MKLSKEEYKRIPRIYLTLDCNLNCDYCVIRDRTKSPDLLLTNEWINLINDLDSEWVILAGGEPTERDDFETIVNGINKKVIVYSNGTRADFNFNKPVYFYLSYHPKLDMDVFLMCAADIKKNHNLIEPINIAIVNRKGAEEDKKKIEKEGFTVEIIEDQNKHLMNVPTIRPRTIVHCNLNRILIGPDGKRYSCVFKLANKDRSGVASKSDICFKYGVCYGCDIVKQEVKEIKGLKLNLGSGKNYMIGFENIDKNPEYNPDKIGDVIRLTAYYEENSADFILARDVLEHQTKIAKTLLEWKKVLKPNGIMVIQVPNMKNISKQLYNAPNMASEVHYMNKVYGDNHKIGFTPNLLKEAILAVGLKIVDFKEDADIYYQNVDTNMYIIVTKEEK